MAFPSQNQVSYFLLNDKSPTDLYDAILQTMATSVKDEIRKTIETMLLALDVPYCANPYDEALHNLSVERAIARGYPMGTDPSVPSIRPFIPIGVSIAANSCAHLETETRVFMALYTALVTFVDDMYADDSAGIRGFVERFSRGEKQANVVLDALVDILKEVPNHYEPVAASIIVMAALNLTNALALEYETRGMKVNNNSLTGNCMSVDHVGFTLDIPSCRRVSYVCTADGRIVSDVCGHGVSQTYTFTQLHPSRFIILRTFLIEK